MADNVVAVQLYSSVAFELTDVLPIKNAYKDEDYRKLLKQKGVIFFRDSNHAGSAFHEAAKFPGEFFYYQFLLNCDTGQLINTVMEKKKVKVFWMDSSRVRVDFL